MNGLINRKLSVAPMLDWTDRHCRYFHRLISPAAMLYSEMITCPAILQGNRTKQLDFSKTEEPVALQLGGSDPEDLARCARIAEQWGYAEVNLNVGCPSDRVQKGRFGACLMKEPELVAMCVEAMRNACDIPITIKSRIGVDDNDDYASFANFIEIVKQAGCQTFIIHARKAILKGLSPKQNRQIPPLKYDFAYQLKQQNPELEIILNGGIDTVKQAQKHLQYVDGVMIGRAFWNSPWLLREMHQALGLPIVPDSRDEVLKKYQIYCQQMIEQGQSLHWLIRPILGLYHGMAGNRNWKSYLVTQAPRRKQDINIITEARALIKL